MVVPLSLWPNTGVGESRLTIVSMQDRGYSCIIIFINYRIIIVIIIINYLAHPCTKLEH